MMRLAPAIVATLVVLPTFSLASSRAAACSISCSAPNILLAPGVNASSPALGISYGMRGPRPSVHLEKEGKDVPTAVEVIPTDPNVVFPTIGSPDQEYARAFLVVPSAPLMVGSYQLTVESDGGAACSVKPVSFLVQREAPLPTNLGRVKASVSTGSVASGGPGADCRSLQRPGMVAKLTIVPSEELGPFLATTRFITRVDGNEWAVSAFGSREPARTTHDEMDKDLRRIDTVGAWCECTADFECPGAVSAGKHRIEVLAEIAGAPLLAPVVVEVDMSCPASFAADAGTAPTSESDRGCTTSPSSPRGGVGATPALGVLFVITALARKLRTQRRPRV